MDIYNHLKGLLGLHKGSETLNNTPNNERSGSLRDDKQDVFTGRFPTEQEDAMGFNVFSNPIEMHRYFEKQMNDMLKIFGFNSGGSPFEMPNNDSFFDFNGFDEQITPPNGSLRQQYLKPGFDHPQNYEGTSKHDDDLDGKIETDDLDAVFSNKQHSPYQGQPKVHLYGQSMMTKTIRNADGTIETRQTIRDNDGNEKTTITRKCGDQEYTIVTKTDKDGKQEITENLLNLDESSVKKFLGKDSDNSNRAIIPQENPHDWFLFDKLFK